MLPGEAAGERLCRYFGSLYTKIHQYRQFCTKEVLNGSLNAIEANLLIVPPQRMTSF